MVSGKYICPTEGEPETTTLTTTIEPVRSLTDIALVTRAVMLHDHRAFDSLVVKYQAHIRRFFLNQTLGNKQLSDDLAQDTFVKAYTCLHQFQGRSGFSTWLYRIAYNVFYDFTRRQRPTADMDTGEVAAMAGHDAMTAEKMDIYNALALLSESERLCVTLQLMAGESLEKIEEITGMAQGTVKSHLFRGKQKLATFLRKHGYGK